MSHQGDVSPQQSILSGCLTAAFAADHGLCPSTMYWAEKVRPQAHPDYCPLAMNIVEFMQCVKGHVTFYKWDALQNLGGIVLKTVSQDPVIPQGHPVTPPTTTDVGGMESNSAEAQGAHDTTLLLFEHPPEEETQPVEPIALPTKVNVGHTLPGPADALQRGMPWSFQLNLK